MKWRDRAGHEILRVRADQIANSPWNHRQHQEDQNAVLDASIETLGFFEPLTVWEPAPGKYMLVNGEARKELINLRVGPDTLIPVNLVDFDENEAKLALAVMDKSAAMAQEDEKAYAQLMAEVEIDNEILEDFLATDESEEEAEVTLTQLDTKAPPKMAWVLIGIPVVRFGEIAETVEQLAEIDGLVLESTLNG